MKTVLYIHGKGGNAAESTHYEKLFPDCKVNGLIEKAYFISPVVNMEKLICDMMKWAKAWAAPFFLCNEDLL